MYLLPKNTKQTKNTKPTYTISCFVCDKDFIPVRHNVVTCGPECSVKQKNNRRRGVETTAVVWEISYKHIRSQKRVLEFNYTVLEHENKRLKEENKQLKAQLGIKE
jgi:hypothetical protein